MWYWFMVVVDLSSFLGFLLFSSQISNACSVLTAVEERETERERERNKGIGMEMIEGKRERERERESGGDCANGRDVENQKF